MLVRPAVGVEDSPVQFVVQFAQDRHQALLVDGLLLDRQRLPGPQLLKEDDTGLAQGILDRAL